MTETAKLKRQVKKYERCFRAVLDLIGDRDFEICSMGGDEYDNPEYKLLDRLRQRIFRSFDPNPKPKETNENRTGDNREVT